MLYLPNDPHLASGRYGPKWGLDLIHSRAEIYMFWLPARACRPMQKRV